MHSQCVLCTCFSSSHPPSPPLHPSASQTHQPLHVVQEDNLLAENTTVTGSQPRRDVPEYHLTKNRSKLAAEARTMLNQFVDQMRSEPEVDLSGKNLMDEGVEFVAEGLAYNNRCRVVHFGSNAIGQRACLQIAEVLKARLACMLSSFGLCHGAF
jgi:hypothetical protein